MIEATAELVRRDPAMKNVQIEIAGEPVWARGDAEWLREVFLNLLLNAAQAMDAKGVVRVTVAANAVVTVRDQGPGIPIERREQVFEPFFTTKPLGTGSRPRDRETACRIARRHGRRGRGRDGRRAIRGAARSARTRQSPQSPRRKPRKRPARLMRDGPN